MDPGDTDIHSDALPKHPRLGPDLLGANAPFT